MWHAWLLAGESMQHRHNPSISISSLSPTCIKNISQSYWKHWGVGWGFYLSLLVTQTWLHMIPHLDCDTDKDEGSASKGCESRCIQKYNHSIIPIGDGTLARIYPSALSFHRGQKQHLWFWLPIEYSPLFLWSAFSVHRSTLSSLFLHTCIMPTSSLNHKVSSFTHPTGARHLIHDPDLIHFNIHH